MDLMPRPPAIACLFVALLVALLPGGRSVAQTAQIQTDELTLRVVQFGISNYHRAGGVVPVQVEIIHRPMDQQATDLIIRVAVPDADGDTAQYERSVVANPNRAQRFWLYPFIPSRRGGEEIRIAVFRAEKDREGQPTIAGNAVGQMLRYTPAVGAGNRVPLWEGMIGSVGPNPAGLTQYNTDRINDRGSLFYESGHEMTFVVGGLSSAQIPDRWYGLGAFESLVWSGTDTAARPDRLTQSQAQAVREWVHRGGHLVVVLPSLGQAWINTAENPLGDIMPEVGIRRVESEDLERYRSLLTNQPRPDRFDSTAPRLPGNGVVNLLPPVQDAGPMSAMPIMLGPDGDPVVVRRLVGAGAVTVIGIDLASSTIASSLIVEADRFWHTILGKRSRLDKKVPNRVYPRREAQSYDEGISSEIDRTGEAFAGLLLGFFVFAGFWLVAGPISFVALKQRQRLQHAWVAFLLITGVFTAIAWGGANIIKVRRVEGAHVSFIDDVFGQPNARVRTYVSLFLPEYGTQSVTIPTADDFSTTPHNTVFPWDVKSISSAAFPDRRGYRIDTLDPDSLDVPARSTVKTFVTDYAGPLQPGWNFPRPGLAAQEGTSTVVNLLDSIRLGPRQPREIRERRWSITGSIAHTLPSTLQDVLILVNPGLRDTNPASLQADVWVFALANGWEPGVVLDLADTAVIPLTREGRGNNDSFFDIPGTSGLGGINIDARTRRTRLRDLAFLPYFAGPAPTNTSSASLLQREHLHTWDLGRWMTQPCVIVVGRVDDAPCPTPISVDGVAPERIAERVRGSTYVRTIFPLEPDPIEPN